MDHRRLVLCLDGTWNSTYAKGTRDDGSSIPKPSNVLKLARAVRPVSGAGISQIVYYDTGIGGDVDSEGGSTFFNKIRKTRDGLFGVGFNANVEQAVTFISHNYCSGPGLPDEVFFYGFSRGAATARAIVKFIDWMGGIPTKSDAYYIPGMFEAYREHEGTRSCQQWKEDRGLTITRNDVEQDRFDPFQPISIKLLAVWDTVYSLGGKGGKGEFHVDAIPPAIVENACHALALDESRGPFAPAIWQGKHAHQHMKQVWFPGVHSNVGGGYPRDGLANLALQWIAAVSEDCQLELDRDFLGNYRRYEFDRLYNSDSLGYRALDKLTFTDAGREVLAFSPETLQQLHPYILARMLATKEELGIAGVKSNDEYETDKYRPGAIKRLLRRESNPEQYCRDWLEQRGDGEEFAIPVRDLVQRIPALLEELR